MIQLNIHDAIVQSALEGIKLQRPDGSLPKGHNGPFYDEDTYVRTTAHWAITLFKAYEITEQQHFLDSAIQACNYLLSKEARPYQKTFYCRTNSTNKIMSNGIIGQVWGTEPLIVIGRALNNEEYLNVAEEVLCLHPYSFEKHGWLNVEIDGQVLDFNTTFVQQVQFTAMALFVGQQNQELLTKARDFLKNVPNVIQLLEGGLIKHTYGQKSKKSIKQLVKNVTQFHSHRKNAARIKKQSLGYLSFILYGFAIARDNFPEENVWHDANFKSIIRRSIDYAIAQYPLDYLGSNEFLWGYNLTGIEIAYALQVFDHYLGLEEAEDNILKWLTAQFNGYYDLDANLMRRNSSDENISKARLYEATRLKNYRINVHK